MTPECALAAGQTELSPSDCRFLERFLDVTKANLFFARGVVIVEGDAENILLPTLARLIGRDFGAHGVSIVNVGGTGLRRFARIFQRQDSGKDGEINVPVACLTDLDVMPDCAPEIIGLVEEGQQWKEIGKRRWRAKSDYDDASLAAKSEGLRAKASGQKVETFVADEWTLEYDLAFFGLAKDVWIAAHLAKADERINAEIFASLNDRDISRRFDIAMGTISFRGSTTAGEMRELCGTRNSYLTILDASFDVAKCLPNRLAEMGHRSIAFHGFRSGFFSRHLWYPAMGFTDNVFFEQFKAAGPEDPNRFCGGMFIGY
ncbi:MAG: hypothetical protein IIC56_08270 [Proteobacteria bacterium]|nr:hypothetical protein [Pseudomonadota bacterium]